MFETASFHLVKPCNMSCKFCYATFQDMKVIKQLPIEDAKFIVLKLKDAGLQKITFAGGEPLLYKDLFELVVYSKAIGLTTSIITNGSLLTSGMLRAYQGHLDWIGISMDSVHPETNQKIGRTIKGRTLDLYDYMYLFGLLKDYGFKIKVNTVVNIHNWEENLNPVIRAINPHRWKILQALRVSEQNEEQFDQIKISDEQFKSFCDKHNHPSMVIEDNRLMTGSYLLIDPQGRLFENSQGKHTYSSPLQHNTIEHCLSEIQLNDSVFVERGGIYNW